LSIWIKFGIIEKINPVLVGEKKEGGEKMKKILVLIVIVAFASIAGADGKVDGDAIRSGWQGVVTLYPGDYFSSSSVLYADAWTDWDAWGFVCIGAGTFTSTITDCCIMGDTMISLVKDFLTGQWVGYDWCTSPCEAVVSVSQTGAFGVYMVLTGYLASPSGYGSGYDIEAIFEGEFVERDLPDTGIELCYNMSEAIPCPAPGDAFYGQDAQYVMNPMSLTDNGDGTVTDNVTELMWQQEDEDITGTWYEAIDYCEALTLAGHTDWKLPDEYELQSIANYGHYDPAIDTVYFPGTFSNYWSSSTSARDIDYAWFVSSQSGMDNTINKTSTSYKYVRCVRGETTTKSYTDNGDGTVTDNVTGLMWQQEDDAVTRDWEDALAYCEGLDLADRTDWRLPDIKELKSIVDNTRYDPAIDETYFPGTPGTLPNYWSSSTHPRLFSADSALAVDFYEGEIFGTLKYNPPRYVRCVR